LPYNFKIEPREYQRQALKFIHKTRRVGLFFEMGTGKTKIALDFLEVMFYHKKIGRAIVIAPLTVLTTWENEIEKNCSFKFDYSLLRPNSSDLWKRSNLILTNYDYLRLRVKDLVKWTPDVVILDESHKIKNHNAKQAKAAHKLGAVCTYAICLTGTPIGNRPLDLWSQFKFLVPDLLEEKFKDFKQRYVAAWTGGGYTVKKYRDMKGLASRIQAHVRSLKKKDFLELPDKSFIEVPVDMPESAREHYKRMEKDFVTYIEQSSEAHPISAPIALAKLSKLSQISGGFIRSTEEERDFPLHTAKLDALKEITDSLSDQGVERLIVYARFSWEIDQIQKLLSHDWDVYEISGRVSKTQREASEKKFTAGGGAIIIQTQMAIGLNLQAANYVIFYSSDYSHINFLQAQDRIHRIGQDKPCFYYLLICRGTLDRRIYRILRDKKDVADHIITLVKEAQKELR